MAAPQPTGMEKAEMRSVLNKASPEHPINFAFGLGKDAAFALLKMDKLKNPRACSQLLADEFGDVKNPRFGTLTVNPEIDSSLVRFMVNKVTSGMAKRLAKTLKGTSFSKVEIVLEDGTLIEAGADEEKDAAAPGSTPAENPLGEPTLGQAAPAPAAPAPVETARRLALLLKRVPAALAANPAAKDGILKLASAAHAALKGANPETVPLVLDALEVALDDAAPAAGQPPEPGPDQASLTRDLAALLKQLPAAIAASPAAKASLMSFATEANTNLKAQKLREAAASIEALRRALEATANSKDDDAPGLPDDTYEEHIADLAAQASVLPEPARSALLGRAKQLKAQPDPAGLDALAAEIVKAAGAARAGEAQQQAGNTVRIRILQKKWNQAEAEAEKELNKFLDDLLGDPELQEDERFPELQAAATEYRALIPDDGGALTAALGAFDEAEETARPLMRKKAAEVVEAYRSDLMAARELETLQTVSDQYYGGTPFLSQLQSALKDLGAALSK